MEFDTYNLRSQVNEQMITDRRPELFFAPEL